MSSRQCATWLFSLALLANFLAACSGETQSTDRRAIIFRGKVSNLDTGEVLSTFCAEQNPDGTVMDASDTRYAEVVHIKAAAGTRVQMDIEWEERSDLIYGPAPPQRDEAFWCAGGGKASRVPILHGWACKIAVPPDPAAIVEDAQPLGVAIDGGWAQGYSLTLRVVHPGIVWTAYEEECSIDEYSRAIPESLGEATVDPF
ncbi:MAG TPA: hypothetical protein VFK05_33510 [Polyangiaceae bacterium]|nr:hypothetical protein [Polyangiaceae bacterium]